MNTLDYVLLAALAVFAIFGFVRGFFRQAIALVGVGLSFFLAGKYHPALAEIDLFASFRERSESVALVASFLIIFFVVAAVAGTIAFVVGRKLKSRSVGAADRWTGALLGTGIGALVLGGISIGLQEWQLPDGAVGAAVPKDVQEKAQGLVASSVLIPRFADACLGIIAFIPQESRDELTKFYEEKMRGGVGTTGADGLKIGSSLTATDGTPPSDPAPTEGRRLLNLGSQRDLRKRFSADSR